MIKYLSFQLLKPEEFIGQTMCKSYYARESFGRIVTTQYLMFYVHYAPSPHSHTLPQKKKKAYNKFVLSTQQRQAVFEGER